jgi:uncharacterized protein involved in exopolysaccharide biosynthesis
VLLAIAFYFFQASYQATALVVITEPTQQLQFDPRITDVTDLGILLRAYPELATSDEVLTRLMAEARPLSGDTLVSLTQLREMMKVEVGVDPRLMRLIVRSGSAQLAADLANTWAGILVATVDEMYRNPGGNVDFYNAQLRQTQAQLSAAEQSLVTFQSDSRMGIVDNELASLATLQAAYLADQRQLSLALDDIGAIRRQIEAGSGDTISWADQLTALMLQLDVYEMAQPTPMSGSDFQLQLDAQSNLTTATRQEQIQQLDQLAQTAQVSLATIDLRLVELEPRLFALQAEKEDIFHQYEELTRNRDVAKETYLTLARKLDEERISAAGPGIQLQLASPAAVPERPARTSLLLLVLLGATAGLLISLAILLLQTWWQLVNAQPLT